MIKTEKQLWQRLKKEFSAYPEFKFTRIETPTKNGVPDIFYTNGVINGWLESKIYTGDVSRVIKLKDIALTANQIKWSLETANSYVLIAINSTGKKWVCDDCVLVTTARDLNIFSKRKWNWLQLAAYYSPCKDQRLTTDTRLINTLIGLFGYNGAYYPPGT